MIHRQILVVRDKKRRKGGGRIQPLLFPNPLLPTTLPCQNINRNLYRTIACSMV
ncbi:hypothetical protein [Aneurinibacillus migulanus]|uniref:hypothetical protein n=1 Tax=Aneurinibacillus migulanus TaxID=47500 RepID=UPI001F3469BA|nr:hypothetical protein [Aneurinibacillus migulanus]